MIRKRWLAMGGAGAVVLAILAVLLFHDDPVVALGRSVYVDHCASCHGADLEGQPNWRAPLPNGRLPAPPHDETGHTWHHSDNELVTIIRDGMAALVPGYQSDMPAFGGVLTDGEIAAVLAFIKSTWEREARAYQAERTANQQ